MKKSARVGPEGPPNRETLLALFEKMLVIRKTEEQLVEAYRRGIVPGPCHTYIGEEGVAAGVCAALGTDDVVFSTHRGHGHALARGVAPGSLLAEVMGRESGVSGGRGGSMHLFAPELGLMGTSGIVGPSILQAAGAAYGFKVLGTSRVAVAFFGDGAANNGAFHEGLNMASIWKLPVVFVCENNLFATEVPLSYAAANPDIAARAPAYALPGIAVDGNDVAAVLGAAAQAVERARSGGGATLIECRTYRTRPHSEGMADFTYRTREEVDSWRDRCPIRRLRMLLVERGHADENDLDSMESRTEEEVAAAFRRALSDPYPPASSASEHVYSAGEPNQSTKIEPPAGERQITFAAATLEALAGEMERDPSIYVMGEGIGKRGGNFATTAGLFDKYGALRLCDTPISERGFTGMAAGAAMVGARPVIDFMFADFELDAAGEIINQISKIHYMSNGRLPIPVVLRGCIGIGHSAATHHSGSYYSVFGHFPGIRVVVPSTPYDAKGLFLHALRSGDPVLFLEHRELVGLKGPVPEVEYEIPFGRAAIVRRGRDITVVAVALMVRRAVEAAHSLAAEGLEVEVIDPRTVSPLDITTIAESVRRTGRVLVVDEEFAPFSLGSEIAAQIQECSFDDLDAPVKRLNGSFAPTPYSPRLEETVVPGVDAIMEAIRETMAE